MKNSTTNIQKKPVSPAIARVGSPNQNEQLLSSVASVIQQSPANDETFFVSLSRELTACSSKTGMEEIIRHRFSYHFTCPEISLNLSNHQSFVHRCHIHLVSDAVQKDPLFLPCVAMDSFVNDGIYNIIGDADSPVVFNLEQLAKRMDKPFYVDFWRRMNARELIGFPLRNNNVFIGAVMVYLKEPCSFSSKQLDFLQAIVSYIGMALAPVLVNEHLTVAAKAHSLSEKARGQDAIYQDSSSRATTTRNEVIGANSGLRAVMDLIGCVSLSDSTVLLQGETGTGKELIAHTIHKASARRDHPMINVNCAAIPAHLFESELFGHEKGSFTGATERRIGKFELADNSTLFLDEIGEMPAELQVKLLRALQEKEIERVGGKVVIKINVRIIAATNRDLEKEVAAGHFRMDLFYRLNVFPIALPSLRERKEDIPLLATHFIEQFTKKFGIPMKGISAGVVRDIMLYSWPGNVRELQHVMERGILMTSGPLIEQVILPRETKYLLSANLTGVKPVGQNERDNIVAALKKSNGRIRGKAGAAELLQIPPTTLHSKMKKWGIHKTIFP